MNAAEAKKITNLLALLSHRDWSEERVIIFTAELHRSTIGVLPFDLVSTVFSRLLEELDPDEITLAKLIEAVKTKPVVSCQPRLEGPAVTGDSPVERGLRRAERLGIPRPPRNEANRALLADMLVQLARQMHFACEKCRRQLNDDDILAYTQACMDAGSCGNEQPERLCIPCVPVEDRPSDEEIPF